MAETLAEFIGDVAARHFMKQPVDLVGGKPMMFCVECAQDWPCDADRFVKTLTIHSVAAGLHASGRTHHNLGEGPARAICQSVSSHEGRAEAMLDAITMKEDT